jgi:hypothetical protein
MRPKLYLEIRGGITSCSDAPNYRCRIEPIFESRFACLNRLPHNVDASFCNPRFCLAGGIGLRPPDSLGSRIYPAVARYRQ